MVGYLHCTFYKVYYLNQYAESSLRTLIYILNQQKVIWR